MLVSLIMNEKDESSLSELKALAESAGAEVVGMIVQKKEPLSSTLFGKGKIEEFKTFIETNDVDLLICDNELSGTQMRNISDILTIKVLDRSSLILDIFAMRATSNEGKLQVELAQAKYNLPRLIGVEGRMSKYGGGIGMRGPGEKKLESDRRIIKNTIDDLSKKLYNLTKQRDLRRQKREKNNEKTVALVGYTNAGKSTVMNLLSKSSVLAENKLFATLDPVTRKVFYTEKEHYLLTDTVGFIDRLPHEFIDAFASTLEEARQADVLLHIIDISDPEISLHYDTVINVLSSLKISTENIITVYNKTDLISGEVVLPRNGDSVKISAKKAQNIDELKNLILSKLKSKLK